MTCLACGHALITITNGASYCPNVECLVDSEQNKPVGMSLNEYQRLSGRTIPTGDLQHPAIFSFLLGLSGEVGELQEHFKKFFYHGHTLDPVAVKKELGDVHWYLNAIATWAGFSMEDIAVTNIEKLKQRYPEGFKEEDSINRED